MRLSSGKRIGQSGSELTLAVSFSFLLHVIVAFAVIFLTLSIAPKKYVPPVAYQVKLVGVPADLLQQPQTEETIPAPPKEEPKPEKTKDLPKTRKTSPPSKTSALPELSSQKSKRTSEQEKTIEKPHEQSSAAKNAENVSVATSQQDFKFAWYLVLVRDKIRQNWRPPPDAKNAKARVLFTVNRSGWVGGVDLDAEHSTGTFGFKQASIRAIRSSNPFPPLPEEFSKQSLEFSVDLMAE